MNRRIILFGVMMSVLFCCKSTLAQNSCTRVGQELCQNGQVYRCEQAGSEIAPIFANRSCTVSASPLLGTWSGSGHQTPAGARASDYPIVMTLTEGGGSIRYATLNCGGSLIELSRSATSAQYRESITYGADKCINGGTISVNLFRGQLSWTWIGQSGGKQINVVAVLQR
jgi:hypothetical protein